MEVTADNFEALYPDILAKIKECDFCSIDCELSGITNYRDLNSFDTPKKRYETMKKNDLGYLILQFGLCLFKKTQDKPLRYDSHAYNFYIFPRSQNLKFSRNSNFSCLNSSLEFLSEQNFDFNKLFNKGITFMSKDTEENARHKLMQTLEERKKPKGTIYPSNNKDIKEHIDKIMSEIDEFEKNDKETTKEIKFSEFLLRLYVEKNIKNKYSQKLKYDFKFLENKERMMIITKKEEKNESQEIDLLEKEIGFSKLVWELSKSGKLLIGHNMLTDIMQIMRQFFSSPLPDKYEDFKMMVNTCFPRILDTKYMASTSPLKDLINNTTLGDMDKILSKDPFVQIIIENCKYSVNDEKLHEAGFDAFLTGFCYLRMMHYLESFNSAKSGFLEFYVNKIFLMKVYDMCHIDLQNEQEFPPNWQTQDIFDLFSPFGATFVAWIDDSSAFVALQNHENTKKAALQLVGVSGREYRVYFYQTYVNQISNNKANKIVSKLAENKPPENNNENGDADKRKRPQNPNSNQSSPKHDSTEEAAKEKKNNEQKKEKKLKTEVSKPGELKSEPSTGMNQMSKLDDFLKKAN